jgi:hypothetical protein
MQKHRPVDVSAPNTNEYTFAVITDIAVQATSPSQAPDGGPKTYALYQTTNTDRRAGRLD